MFGVGPLVDAGVVAGVADLGALLQAGGGRAAAAHGAVVMGTAAVGGVLA